MNPGDSVKFDSETNTIHIQKTDGVLFRIGGKTVDGDIKIEKNTTVRAYQRGRLFDEDVETQWVFKPSGLVDSTESEESEDEDVEDIPSAPTAGSTPQNPEQGRPSLNIPNPGPRPPQP